MFHVGLAHAFKTVRLNQFHNALKAGSNIKRKVIKRLSDQSCGDDSVKPSTQSWVGFQGAKSPVGTAENYRG